MAVKLNFAQDRDKKASGEYKNNKNYKHYDKYPQLPCLNPCTASLINCVRDIPPTSL